MEEKKKWVRHSRADSKGPKKEVTMGLARSSSDLVLDCFIQDLPIVTDEKEVIFAFLQDQELSLEMVT